MLKQVNMPRMPTIIMRHKNLLNKALVERKGWTFLNDFFSSKVHKSNHRFALGGFRSLAPCRTLCTYGRYGLANSYTEDSGNVQLHALMQNMEVHND